MINLALAYAIHFMPCALQFPAQINFLHMCKVVFVQSTHPVKCACPDNHTGAGSPENAARIVILPGVPLQAVENPTPAKWISQAVDKSSSCTVTFKCGSAVTRKTVGLARCKGGASVH